MEGLWDQKARDLIFSDKDTGRKPFQLETRERNGHLLHVGKHWDFFPFYDAGAQNSSVTICPKMT